MQQNRFVVQVEGHGEGLETALVDRFDIAVPPVDAPGAEVNPATNAPARAIQPHIYLEDWQVLEELHDRVWKYREGKSGLKPHAVIVDSQGLEGVTPRAYQFWLKMQRQARGKYYLYRGVGGLNHTWRAHQKIPENQQGNKRKRSRQVKVVFAATNNLKPEILASLARESRGPLAYHITQALPRNLVEEYTNEHFVEGKGWQKKKSHFRNESLDLAVMNKSLLIVLETDKINWKKPRAWARLGDGNPNFVKFDESGKPAPPTKSSSGKSLAKARASFLKL